jgi:hypothetical protein
MADVNIIMSSEGAIPTPPATIRSNLVNKVSSSVPDYTSDLPGGLIEDVVSTDVGAIATIDAAMIDTVNSVSPLGCNEYILTELANMAGISKGGASNTSVYCVFTGTPGYVISSGFKVSDGSYQYITPDGGIIGSNGTSSPINFVAVDEGSWAVAVGTVTSIATSVPSSITLSVTNQNAGTPGDEDGESWNDFRTRVLMAGYTPCQGTPSYLKTRLCNVSGVQSRLVSIINTGDGWEILCGGGDSYETAYEIYKSIFDLSSIVGSSTTSRNITVSVNDYPDTYSVTYVNPVAQTVTMTVTWNTSATNSVSSDSVATLAKTALAAYINGIYVGKPINILDMETAFRNSISSAVQPSLITKLVFTVYINGSEVGPATNSKIISGDSEGYFTATTTGITVTEG